MISYTVVWTASALGKLAELWIANPRIRDDITDATAIIERSLQTTPLTVGVATSEISRLIASPPLTVLYRVEPMDMQVRVIHVRFWDD